ncbi:GTP 3',8-cyclase MoaA [Lactococcus termiticola]|uniref:GTP 3',8-cyclase n=1 Tax=Lactococcus termiticola TaxID=2169526 RepID=A0A2R5HG80_9LACT|nr:GTP 3',8-cyclase MoaA [Lactococcus termiticola]GBG96335.1 molybdenum cofactor biosynthesis protein A [Lactococcus termiticola]
MTLIDKFGRKHDYLRLSITDKCSLRCVYCMPEEGLEFFPDDKVLSGEEIIQLVENFAKLGIEKVRITGGEPLMRHDILDIIRGINAIPGIKDIALTTNGLALKRMAGDLYEAGVKRINISLDTFKPEKYREITRGGNIRQVIAGLEVASQFPFELKMNCVVIAGQNADEVVDFLQYSIEHPVNVRFIEFMPIGHNSDRDQKLWQDNYKGIESVFDICQEKGWEYEPIGIPGNGPSENFQIKGGQGSFGLIHPVSCQFCESCNRLRVTADGALKSCLYWDDEDNVREVLNDFEAFEALIQKSLNGKPENHEMALAENEKNEFQKPTWRHMSQIGG